MFETFKGKKYAFNSATVALLKTGSLFLNSTCYEKYLARHKYVELLFDKERRIIGIQPTNTQERHVYLVRQNKRGSGCSVSARSFCKFYGIDYEKHPGRFDVKWNEKHKLIEVDLNKS